MNIVTKNNLESQHFLSFSSAVQARLTQCLRNDGSNIRPFSAPSEAIEAIKDGLNRVQPRNPGMRRISGSADNSFDQPMVEAVLAYKSINSIIRTGQKLDNVVGRGTLARLDSELKNLGPRSDVVPPALPFGSTNFRFTLRCDKGAFAKAAFQLSIKGNDAEGSKNFAVREFFSNGGLASGFAGTCTGTFTTSRATPAKDFENSLCDISITRGASSSIQGTMLLTIGSANPFGRLETLVVLPRFRDETLGLTQGTAKIRGFAAPV
jgi:hypothetical protein